MRKPDRPPECKKTSGNGAKPRSDHSRDLSEHRARSQGRVQGPEMGLAHLSGRDRWHNRLRILRSKARETKSTAYLPTRARKTRMQATSGRTIPARKAGSIDDQPGSP